jgi:hypothetical protein
VAEAARGAEGDVGPDAPAQRRRVIFATEPEMDSHHCPETFFIELLIKRLHNFQTDQ